MPVPFGFSVGDFVAVLGLFKDLTLALQDRGGSSADYQKTAVDLETVATILLELQSLQPADSNLSQINSIRGQAYKVYHDVQQFLNSIQVYDSKLGPQAARGFHRSPFAKIKWSQSIAVKVKQLRKAVHLQTTNLQLLLSLLIQHNQKVDRTLFEATLAKHSLAIERLAEHIESIKGISRPRLALAQEQAARAFQSIQDSDEAIADSSSRAENHNSQDSPPLHAPEASSDSTPALEEQNGRTLPIRNLQNTTGSMDNRRVFESTIESYAQPSQSTSTTGGSLNVFGQDLDPQLMPFRELSVNICTATLSFLTLKAVKLLQRLLGSLVTFLKEVLRSLPHTIIILRLLQQIPRAVSLMYHDNIRFEDALGRMHSLQYQYFRHWAVFEACLHSTFKDTPGMQKVLRGQFVLKCPLKCPRAADKLLDATNWEQNASPGMVVTMAISISTILAPRGRCPRGCSAGRAAILGSEARCTRCDLSFSISRLAHTDIIRSIKFVGARSKPRVSRSIRRRRHNLELPIPSDDPEKRLRREAAARRLETQLNIDQAQVSDLMTHESSQEEQQTHRLEEREVMQFKRIHLVEDTAVQWTWSFGIEDKPWNWAWHVELPEVRAEWKTAAYWQSISPALLEDFMGNQITEGLVDQGFQYPSSRNFLATRAAEQLAFQFSQSTPPAASFYSRAYVQIYKGSLSFTDNNLAVAKVPFIHLLATRPLTSRQIRYFFRMPSVECHRLLNIFARDCPADPDKKELREVSYKELDVWGFPYPSEKERRSAIKRSIQAFDILRIDRHDDLWQLLLPVDRRGKGICLSRRGAD